MSDNSPQHEEQHESPVEPVDPAEAERQQALLSEEVAALRRRLEDSPTRAPDLEKRAQAVARQLEAGPYVRIDVSDNGSGMDDATQARVFEPFFTTKPNGLGTGLGMAMVYGFVKQSGGAIDIRSKVDQGTTVSMWLPACDVAIPPPGPMDGDSDDARGDQGLALLVDDDPAVRQVVRRQLLDLGYVVIEAESGGEAMQILDQTPGIALLLTDVVMPRMSGFKLAKVIRQTRPETRTLYVSGYAYTGRHEGETIAPETFLAKPFSPDMLALKVRRVLSEPVITAT